MRIALDTRAITRASIRGIAIYQHALLSYLSKQDHTVFAIAERDKFRLPLPSNVTPVIVPVRGPEKLKGFIWSQIDLARTVKKLKVDIYHATDNDKMPVWDSARTIVTIHDVTPLILPDYITEWSKKPFSDRLIHQAYMQINKLFADAIITVSHASKHDISRTLKISSEKIHVVNNGYTSLHSVSRNRALKMISRYHIVPPYFLFFGGIEARKNLNTLVSAFTVFKKLHPQTKHNLVIAGQIKSVTAAEKTFQQLKVQLSLPENAHIRRSVVFPGEIAESNKGAVYQLAEALIYPSIYEGFGIPILEAMSAGTPVVTSNNSGMKEVAEEAALLVNPLVVEDWANAMVQISTNSALKEELVAKGKIRCKKYSWEKCGQQTEEIYKRTIFSDGKMLYS